MNMIERQLPQGDGAGRDADAAVKQIHPGEEGYTDAILGGARFEALPNGTVYGFVPGFDGVVATEATETTVRERLDTELDKWISFRQEEGLRLPIIKVPIPQEPVELQG